MPEAGRKTRTVLVAAFALLLLSGCAAPSSTPPPSSMTSAVAASPTAPPCEPPSTEGAALEGRSLFVRGGAGGLYRYDWDVGFASFLNASYAPYVWGQESRPLPAANGSFVYAANDTALIRFDTDLVRLGETPVDRPMALAAWEGHVLAATNGTLRIFDDELQSQSQLALVGDGRNTKTAHDVVIDRGTAFVVDNVVMPYYAFRVDVRDPQHPGVLSRTEINVVSGHIGPQWLDHGQGQWAIQTFSSGLGTGGVIQDYDLAYLGTQNGTRLGTQESGFFGPAHRVNPKVEVQLLGSGAYVNRLQWGPGAVKRDCARPLDVDLGQFGQASIIERGGLAWILVGQTLRVVNTNDLSIVHAQDLNAHAVLFAVL